MMADKCIELLISRKAVEMKWNEKDASILSRRMKQMIRADVLPAQKLGVIKKLNDEPCLKADKIIKSQLD